MAVAAAGNFGGGGFGGGFRRFAADASHTVTVHLTAPVTLGIIAAAVALALAGGLIAGIVRRLAGRPAPPCGRPGQGRMTGGASGPACTADLEEGKHMYKLTGVTKDYRKDRGTVAALRGIDLVIEDGEWLAIQGPTGHGKSTLLQIPRRAGPADGRHRRLRRPGPGQHARKPGHQGAGRVHRVRLPDVQPGRLRSARRSAAALVLAAPPAAQRRARRRGGAGRTSGSATACCTCPQNCPAASSSASRSPGRW